MALTSGTKLGPYEIQSPLGAGGMGEVYRATDSKLGRDVALKVILQEFAQDTQLMARFQREAQVLASLNHTNVASIYGLEDSGGVRALVMELVEGPTLADRIRQGAIPQEEALPIAKQIAEALEYAHERGIVHRDLKPANIKVTHDGKVKVLDFGLAKALQGDAAPRNISNSPTLTLDATKAGIILGKAELITMVKRHPLARALRADKLCLAALAATLLHYLKDEAEREIPIWRMMALMPDQVRQTAEGWGKQLGQGTVIAGKSTIGGGSLPEESLPTFLLALDGKSPDKFLKKLRQQQPPIIARTEKDRILLDPRTVLPEEAGALLVGLMNALQDKKKTADTIRG